jgi:hypothetical protein
MADEQFLFQLLRRGREYGENVIVCDQTASLLGHTVVANIYCFISFSQSSGREIKFVRDEMYLTGDQPSGLNKLEVGHAVVKMAGRYPDPFLIEVPMITYEKITDQEVEERMKPVLESIQIEPAVDLLTSRGSNESDPVQENLWKRMLKNIIADPFIGVGKRYKQLKLSPWVGDKIANELVTMGLATSHSVGFGRRGDTTRFLWPTREGFKYIGKAEIKLAGKGGFEHVVIANKVAECLKSNGYNPKIEAHVNGKSVDICFIKGGREIAIEIETDPGEDHIAINILKDLKAGFSEVWVLLKTKDQIKRAKETVFKALATMSNSKGSDSEDQDQKGQKGIETDLIGDRVHFRLIREFLL